MSIDCLVLVSGCPEWGKGSDTAAPGFRLGLMTQPFRTPCRRVSLGRFDCLSEAAFVRAEVKLMQTLAAPAGRVLTLAPERPPPARSLCMSPKQAAVPEAGAPPVFFPIGGSVKIRPFTTTRKNFAWQFRSPTVRTECSLKNDGHVRLLVTTAKCLGTP
jgi:hypothetical protein